MPVQSRSRSAAAVLNDKKILDAAVFEAASAGLDNLGFGGVAGRAKLTTGAMYARFSDTRDLQAALWIERLGGPTTSLLSECMDLFVSRPGTCGAEIVARLSRLSRVESVGLEAVLIARRVPELEEVLSDEMRGVLRDFGLGEDVGANELAQVRSVLGLSVIFGCVINSYFEKDLSSWRQIFDVVSLATSIMKPTKAGQKSATTVAPLVAQTESELRNILIDSASEVIARSGVAAATVARIARRSRMTSGAIYTLYASRDELLLDAMEHLLAQTVETTTAIVREGERRDAAAEAMAELLWYAFVPSRAQWRMFRLETYVAARSDRSIAGAVRRIQKLGTQRYRTLFEGSPNVPFPLVDALARFGQNQPIGLSVLETYCAHLGGLNYMAYSEALLEVRRIVAAD